MSKAFKLRIHGKEYDVVVGDLTRNPVEVQVNGQSFLVELSPSMELSATPVTSVPPPPARPADPQGARRSDSAEEGPPGEASAPSRSPSNSSVLAPMPGSIMNLQVKPGQRVEVGDVLCYLEAMKMHNPIHAPSAGVIEEVAVTEGQAVAYGQVLVKYVV